MQQLADSQAVEATAFLEQVPPSAALAKPDSSRKLNCRRIKEVPPLRAE